MIVLIPYKQDKLPHILTVLKAVADFASMMDNPNAANTVCIKTPVDIPKTDATPVFLIFRHRLS